MAEPVKSDPQVDTPKGEPCSNCGQRHKLQPGSKGWFWAKRVENLALFLVPSIPAVDAVAEFIAPQATVTLTDVQSDMLNKTFEAGGSPSTVERVIVELDAPTLAERLASAAPSLLLAGLLAFVAYALWRIEINMTAGKGQRPFTEKDGRILKRSSRFLYWGWFATIAVEAAGFLVLRLGPSDMEWGIPGVSSEASLVILGLAILVGTMARVYYKGSQAYESLEKIV